MTNPDAELIARTQTFLDDTGPEFVYRRLYGEALVRDLRDAIDAPCPEGVAATVQAIRDDIRGCFKSAPKYRDSLARLLAAQAREIERLRKIEQNSGPLGVLIEHAEAAEARVRELEDIGRQQIHRADDNARGWLAATDQIKEIRTAHDALLAALKQLVADYECVPDATDTDDQAVFERARAAIRLAETEPT